MNLGNTESLTDISICILRNQIDLDGEGIPECHFNRLARPQHFIVNKIIQLYSKIRAVMAVMLIYFPLTRM